MKIYCAWTYYDATFFVFTKCYIASCATFIATLSDVYEMWSNKKLITYYCWTNIDTEHKHSIPNVMCWTFWNIYFQVHCCSMTAVQHGYFQGILFTLMRGMNFINHKTYGASMLMDTMFLKNMEFLFIISSVTLKQNPSTVHTFM